MKLNKNKLLEFRCMIYAIIISYVILDSYYRLCHAALATAPRLRSRDTRAGTRHSTCITGTLSKSH